MRRELLAREKAKRKKSKTTEQVKDQTAEIYNEIVQEMGDKYFQGYQTESESEQEEEEVEPEQPVAIVEMDEQTKKEMAQEKAMIPNKYVMSCRSPGIFYWDFCIILFAVLNAITLPLEIAFLEELKQFSFLPTLNAITARSKNSPPAQGPAKRDYAQKRHVISRLKSLRIP